MNTTIIPVTTSIPALSPSIFDRWISYLDAAPKTVETYTRNLRQFASWLQENEITAPTRDDVLAFRDALRTAQKSASTIQGYITTVKLFFAWCAQEGLYPDVAEHIKGAKLDTEHKKDPLSADQTSALLSGIARETESGARDYAIISLMATTGLRTVSVVNANVEDVKTVYGVPVLFYKGKGHDQKAAYVKLAPQVYEAILSYLSLREKTTCSPSSPLFASCANRNSGERMTTRSVSRIAAEHMEDAGVKTDRITAHSLRHTAATLNLLNGGTVEETMQMLGHKSITTTMIYSHALERMKNMSENRVACAIFG